MKLSRRRSRNHKAGVVIWHSEQNLRILLVGVSVPTHEVEPLRGRIIDKLVDFGGKPPGTYVRVRSGRITVPYPLGPVSKEIFAQHMIVMLERFSEPLCTYEVISTRREFYGLPLYLRKQWGIAKLRRRILFVEY